MPITIDGLSELSEKLANESVRTAKRYLLNCAKPAAEVVIAAADATVPVSTGKLENSMDYQSHFSDENGGTTLTVRIGPKKSAQSHYGSLQEFGTRFQPAQRWLTRAFEACKDNVLSVFATEILARLADMEEKGK